MIHTLLSIKYCEEKYLGYLNDSRWGMNQDFFIYKNENSITNAEANIDKLKEIYERIN